MRASGERAGCWTIGIRMDATEIRPDEWNIAGRAIVTCDGLPGVPMSVELLFKDLRREGEIDAGIQDLDRANIVLACQSRDIPTIELCEAHIEMRVCGRQVSLDT